MTFLSRMLTEKRRYRQYKKRVEMLPSSYRSAVAAFERYTNHLGGIGDADSILAMFDDLVALFEQAAADGATVREIVGDDPVEFAETFLRNYPAGQWIVREQERLSAAITPSSTRRTNDDDHRPSTADDRRARPTEVVR